MRIPTSTTASTVRGQRQRLRQLTLRAVALLAVILLAPASLTQPATATEPDDGPAPTEDAPAVVPEGDRHRLLGNDWATSDDTLYAAVGDQFAFRIFSAAESEGYAWKPLASLGVASLETDRWIGNSCVTGDGRSMAVVYAPRGFTNDEAMTSRGAFAAVVDLSTGAVTDLGQGYSLAHFNPGCGVGDNIVLSSYAEDTARTMISTLSVSDPNAITRVEVATQLTSSTIDESGVISAVGGGLVRVGPDGGLTPLVETNGTPYDLTLGADGDLFFIEPVETQASVKRVVAPGAGATDPALVETLATADIQSLGIGRDHRDQVYLLGAPAPAGNVPDSVTVTDAPTNAVLSSSGRSALLSASPVSLAQTGEIDAAGPSRSFEFLARPFATDEDLRFIVPMEIGADGARSESRLGDSGPVAETRDGYGDGSPTDVVEGERACAVPRNDPANQALQPKPRQVEWAVDQAVSGDLTVTRPANWKNLGMSAYTPQGMFPKPTLSGGGDIPAQVMLGVLAQESNLWQASVYTTPGVTGNPLIGNFYGNPRTDDDSFWQVDFENADCGYGVSQVTDGMRLAGRERPGEVALPHDQQRAIALDFAANVAKGLQMLGEKWNETRTAGLTINDGKAEYLENWFFAVWAYNSGFYPDRGDGSPWGVGWLNNPANPIYDQSRAPFLDGEPSDAAHPQDWPYPEKVMGFAAHSLELYEDAETLVAGFRTAWWTGSDGQLGVINRQNVKPPADKFCGPSNNCSPGAEQQPGDPEDPPGPCLHQDANGEYDLKCWYHGNATWKSDCSEECGREFIRFDPGWEYQDDATSFPPNCGTTGLPSGALIIDNLTSGQPTPRPNCAPVPSAGSFGFAFASDDAGNYPSKVDTHQLGAGFNGHFYLAHTRGTGENGNLFGGKLGVTGTWTLNQPLTQWARVLVHMPDHGAWTQEAVYTINLGNGVTKTRSVLQRHYANRWVSLGVFPVSGTPSVSLSNVTERGDGVDDVAWDAVAFEPLAGKPTDIVVALGDSFSSGEGAPNDGASPYYRDSDHHGSFEFGDEESRFRNGCHRSADAWSRKSTLSSNTTASIGQRADFWAADMDYHLLACSGAETENLLPNTTAGDDPPTNAEGEAGVGKFTELSQMDRGFLDEHTTLVTLSIGGNDARFSDIISTCLVPIGPECKDRTLADDEATLEVATAARTSSTVPTSVITVLEQIRMRAPNATIALMGYPKLFETGSGCILIGEHHRSWLNTVADDLNAGLVRAAAAVDSPSARVVFGNPTSAFSGRNLCADNSAINGFIIDFTPGDRPMFQVPRPGDDFQLGVSQQSVHPNNAGTSIYADVLMEALSGVYP